VTDYERFPAGLSDVRTGAADRYSFHAYFAGWLVLMALWNHIMLQVAMRR
jgi:hypothetical protein